MDWKKAIVIVVMWVASAAVAIIMEDPKILGFALAGTFLIGMI